MVLGRCVQCLVAVFGILSPLERGRGVLEYINITIFVDDCHTPPTPSLEGRIRVICDFLSF